MPHNELFIGNLDRHVTQRDIESIFDKYGKILRCDVKNRGKRRWVGRTKSYSFNININFKQKW